MTFERDVSMALVMRPEPTYVRDLVSRLVEQMVPDVTISGFNGLMSKSIGAIPIRLKVGRVIMNTAFFIIDVATTFNALERDWLHKASSIPCTLH
ncbi:hypothetical protein MLD38_025437 [Melastoma candidum]|uniref:Uncharacterized protein n=1 Tax=Melastoma candidum TaxID=119954 RepID=A0ACB9P0I9_9MYRT|nr:hypothetical protein MLD38_025437 [Melastoma candidum]